MKISEFIAMLVDCMEVNGDLDVVGIANGRIFQYVDINVPDDGSPLYVELCD